MILSDESAMTVTQRIKVALGMKRLVPSCLWIKENEIQSSQESTTENNVSVKESKLLHKTFVSKDLKWHLVPALSHLTQESPDRWPSSLYIIHLGQDVRRKFKQCKISTEGVFSSLNEGNFIRFDQKK